MLSLSGAGCTLRGKTEHWKSYSRVRTFSGKKQMILKVNCSIFWHHNLFYSSTYPLYTSTIISALATRTVSPTESPLFVGASRFKVYVLGAVGARSDGCRMILGKCIFSFRYFSNNNILYVANLKQVALVEID